ncbi:carbamoyl phosphate synthase small subunit [Metabacillus sp. GX 13764]|uniref:carbamoyl phosphate synthase small subunit n=1 Tax=Metabacillus kandeliae TaxID=2900151 RepID=UPI001E4D408D|nr:carbamoyl phosphate synthase small subunit [Metabacillus kandeliae]MCD7033862.1 carbamoyl phosphate synthase small subunit [Metabacillus kandeliae]
MKKILLLEDGTQFIGKGFGAQKEAIGETVFHTGMTGYQEILSDPSYSGQLVAMTYPLIGNYGISRDDFETISPFINGFIVKELCDLPSNWRSEWSLDSYFQQKGIPGISGIDTRKLTRVIRQHGTMKGIICSETDLPAAFQKLRATVLPRNQVERVSTKTAYPSPGRGHRVVLVDYGMKHGILRELNKRHCDVVVVPHNTELEDILRLRPDGIMLSNGPGDPKDVPQAIGMIQGILGKVPLFGICLGHQLFALASGADTEKMKFGHRGANHPVIDLETEKTAITSQNHGYTVKEDSLLATRLVVTHKALNDGSVEGLRHLDYPAFTVQYHPEASPGPEDANPLFDQFLNMIEMHKREGAAV